jgi:hypothetical protein
VLNAVATNLPSVSEEESTEEEIMKTLSIVGASLTLFSAMAFAGPNVSGGPSATENLTSKRKIEAVLNVITEPNEVVQSVELDAGGMTYLAKIRTGESCEVRMYKVKASGPMAQYQAQFVDSVYAGPCQ